MFWLPLQALTVSFDAPCAKPFNQVSVNRVTLEIENVHVTFVLTRECPERYYHSSFWSWFDSLLVQE